MQICPYVTTSYFKRLYTTCTVLYLTTAFTVYTYMNMMAYHIELYHIPTTTICTVRLRSVTIVVLRLHKPHYYIMVHREKCNNCCVIRIADLRRVGNEREISDGFHR